MHPVQTLHEQLYKRSMNANEGAQLKGQILDSIMHSLLVLIVKNFT